MKGMWMSTVIVMAACISIAVLPMQTTAQQPLDELPADFPEQDIEENLPPLDEVDAEPDLGPPDEQLPLDDTPPLEGEPPQNDFPALEPQEDPFTRDQMEPAAPDEAVERIVVPQALQHCTTAAGKVIFKLTTAGIDPGVTYIKAGAHLVFSNRSNAGHDVKIIPSGFFKKDSFRVTINSSVHVKASSPGTVTRGRIVVNQGRNETERYVVICP